MIISNCPRCQEGFRVPTGTIPDDAYAVCPWCNETFPLTEVLNQLPPVLQILSADGEPIEILESGAIHSAAGMQALSGASAGAFDHLQPTDGAVSDQPWDPTALNFGDGSGQTDTGWNPDGASQTVPMSVSPRPNRRKKSGSGIRSMVQVVVGGLLSVPIALAILLAVGRAPDLGFWPFDGQARSPRELLPFLDDSNAGDETTFPKFEGQQLDTSKFDDAMEETEDPGQSALDQIFAPDESPETEDQSSLDEKAVITPNQTAVRQKTDTTAAPAQPQKGTIPPELPDTLTNTSTDSLPLKEPESADAQISNSPADLPTSAIAASQIKSSEQLSDSNTKSNSLESVPAQALIKVTAAIQAIEKLDADDQTIDTDTLAEAYERIAEACVTAQKYPAALSSLANAVSKSTALKQIQEAAVTWLDYPQRSAKGILLIGKPGATAKSQILTLDSGRVLTLSGKLNLPLAEQVVVLGQITDQQDEIEISFTAPLP